MPEKSCLILTSEKTEFDRYFLDVAEHSLRSMDIDLLRLHEHTQIPGERVKSFVAITELIERANFLLVNITEHKADLMYQIGYAHALGKLVMFYVHEQANNNIPEFLAGYCREEEARYNVL